MGNQPHGYFDPPDPYIFAPNGWDAAWKAAVANRWDQRVCITGIGDSVMSGFECSDFMATSWWAVLRAALLNKYGQLAGDHYSPLYSAANGTGGQSTATYPVVVAGVANTDYAIESDFFTCPVYFVSNAQNPLVSVTPPYSVVGFDVFYVDGYNGSFSWAVDGGGATTVTTSGPGTAAGSKLGVVRITGLTAGTHTLKLRNTSGAWTGGIVGVTCWAASTGLAFANMGWPGFGLCKSGSGDANLCLCTTAGQPPDKRALYQGYLGTTAAPTALTGLGFPTQPDLAIVALGLNDAYNASPPTRTVFRDNLQYLLQSLRFGKGGACSVMLVANWGPDGLPASATQVQNTDFVGADRVPVYHDFRAAMAELAQTCCCAYVDVYSALGANPVTNGWIRGADDTHPTDAGHAKMAALIGGLL